MQSVIDYSNDNYGITVNITGGTVKVTLDIGTICSEAYYSKAQAKDIAEQILNELGDKTSSDWEDEVYKLQERINDLEEQIEEYEERMEYMRNKDRYVPF